LKSASGSTVQFMAKKSLRSPRALRLNSSIKTVSTCTPKTANFKIFLSLTPQRLSQNRTSKNPRIFDSIAQAHPTKGNVCSLNTMKKSIILFGRLNNEVRRNFTLRSCRAEDGSADKAMAFRRSSLREMALPKNASRPKLCALCVLSGKTFFEYRASSIEYQVCKTNPISDMPKWL